MVFDGKYAITILGVNETEERNQYSDKDVRQVLIIDYLYENISEEKEDIYISDMYFKFIDEHGNMCDTYPVGGIYGPQHTPVGGRTLTSMTIGTVEESQTIKVYYYDNMFDSKVNAEFELVIGENVEFSLAGSIPTYNNMYNIGDIIEIETDDGKYTLCIDSIKLINERNQYSETEPNKVYKIGYTYSNINIDKDLYISDMDFRVIDANGNMAFTYPGNVTKYPQATIKGARSAAEMIFGTHTEGDTLVLCYTENMFSNLSDFKIFLTDINNN